MIKTPHIARQRITREAQTFCLALGLSFVGAVVIRVMVHPPGSAFSWLDLISILAAYSLSTLMIEHRAH